MDSVFKQREEKLLVKWEENKIYQRLKDQTSGGEKFYFLQGPPFTSGEAHLGHAWNHSIKDSVLRYKRMRGFDVFDRAGWDCHGLPVEIKVEKKLEMKSKRDIDVIGMEKFVSECESFVEWSRSRMTDTFKRMAVWMDWEDPYLTYKNNYIESVWYMIKKANEKGLLYRGERVVSWCPRCVTALAANYEVEYKEVTDPSIFVKFPIVGEEGKYIVVWTTTPWTLPANVGVTVHPEFDYATVDVIFNGNAEKWILAQDLVEKVCSKYCESFEIRDTVRGSDLKIRYTHPLSEEVPSQKSFGESAHFIINDKMVTLEDGSGCVHTAPGHGKEDFDAGKKFNLPVFCPVNENGKFTKEGGKYEGMYVKDSDQVIISDLKEKGLLVGKEKIKHNYLHCERCKQPIIYRATAQWFLKVSQIRDKLIDENKTVKWIPEFIGSNRFGKWLEGIEDWCISRQRYWNTPLPVWMCENDHVSVIGSRKELEENSGSAPENLHRPWIDSVKIKCSQCDSHATRVTDVMDVWLDSGSSSWATLGFPESSEKKKSIWPVDFITEGSDQTRGWFYSLLGCSVMAFDEASYKTVLYHGFTLDSDGRKMSKSLGNVVAPEEFMEKHGVDVMRFYLLWASVPWEDLKFVWDDVKQVERFLNIFKNVYEFYLTYSKACGIENPQPKNLSVEDSWMLSSVNTLVDSVSQGYDNYLPHEYTRPIEKFVVEDLSRIYVKLIRPRTWPSYDGDDREAAFYVLREALLSISKILAPVCPFIADEVYTGLGGSLDSVHLEAWPESGKTDPTIEESMRHAKSIVESINSIRQENSIGLRYPVKAAKVSGDDDVTSMISNVQGVIKTLSNVKEIEFGRTELDVDMKLNFVKVGPKYGKDLGSMAKELSSSDMKAVWKELSDKGKVTICGNELTEEDFLIDKKIPKDLAGKEFSGGVVYLDTEQTPQIVEESFIRELIRNIQEERKKLGLKVEENITIHLNSDEGTKKIIESWSDEIKDSTGSSQIQWSDEPLDRKVEFKDIVSSFKIS